MTALDTWMQLSLACAGVAVCLAQAWPQPATAQQPADSPYERWLTQDVAYIIEDGERAVFTTLASDDERQRFIEQFWERRDPTPGTPENEAREQHYHRIAYANSRYTSSFEGSLPGWRTDRGRFYLVHGPRMRTNPIPRAGGAATAVPSAPTPGSYGSTAPPTASRRSGRSSSKRAVPAATAWSNRKRTAGARRSSLP